MSRLIYNVTENKWIDRSKSANHLVRGVLNFDSQHCEFGYFSEEENYRMVVFGRHSYPLLLRTCTSPIYFDRARGYYSITEPDNNMIFGHSGWPYSFTRFYSTRYLEEKFHKCFQETEDILYSHIDELPYTFGLEYETSAGYIPEEELYRVGLIPLRDGSITGLEYSTIVLQGNVGLNALRRQIEVLREYTIYDKECSLHMHIGSFNVTPEVILRLNNLFAGSDIDGYVTPWAFRTGLYKKTGKEYCVKNKAFMSFTNLYSTLVGRNYLGSLKQPHPSDTSGDKKWQITQRYKALNLINAVCYNNAKTAEFRCLRPTYNFDKILVWLFVFGAYVKYAENLKLKNIRSISLERIIKSVYSVELANMLIRALRIQKDVVQTQILVNDNYGLRTDIEDQIMTHKNLSKNCKFFY